MRSAGHDARASGIEARKGRDGIGGSIRSTQAWPERATPLKDQDLERLAGQGRPCPDPLGGASYWPSYKNPCHHRWNGDRTRTACTRTCCTADQT